MDNNVSSKDKKIEKVVHGEVKTKKASASKKFADVILAEDVADAKSYIIWDVIVPIVKDGISVVFHSTIDAIFGSSRGSYYNNRNQGNNRTNYTRYSYKDDRREPQRRYSEDRDRDKYRTYGYDDIILDNRGEAELVLDNLNDIVDEYGLASVGDYYELVGISGNFQDNKYGWTNLRAATVERVMGGGYRIKLPKARPLD